MAHFNLNDYETVESRIERFWEKYPDGKIFTELVESENGRFIMRASVHRSEESYPMATGYAEEVIGSSPVNKTSALENCETSAIGRALANAGFATKGKRASREEMSKVQRGEKIETKLIDEMAVKVTEVADLEALRVLYNFCSNRNYLSQPTSDGKLLSDIFNTHAEQLKSE